MNNIIEKKNIFRLILIFYKKNLKKIYICVSLIIVIILSIQFYLYFKNQKILKDSILFNLTKSNLSNNDYRDNIEYLSNENNFYGTLATLESIKIKLEENHNNLAFLKYIELLNNDLKPLYKNAVVSHASYSLLNNLDNKQNNTEEKLEIISNIKKILEFFDMSLSSYEGIRLEILYLLSIAQQDIQNIDNFKEIKELFNQIQENEQISFEIKDRVKKINDFQEFK